MTLTPAVELVPALSFWGLAWPRRDSEPVGASEYPREEVENPHDRGREPRRMSEGETAN